jgi:hypothetical protein
MNADVEAIVKQSKAPLNGDLAPTPRLADLLDEIDHTIRQYVKLPVLKLAVVIATWIALTYCFEQFRYCGYLALRSATPRCGKTTLLRLLSQLTNGAPPITASPTAAILFRSTRPVLLLDEVDRLRNKDKDQFGDVMLVLNFGFEQGGIVERCDRKTHDIKQFPVYGPKALAGIEGVADTLADRSFQIQMERSADRMPRLNLRKMDERFRQLREGVQQWADDREKVILEAYDALPDELDALKEFDDRFQDISEPLIVLATLADAERPEGPHIVPRLLEGLKAAAGRREPSGREKQLQEFLVIAIEKLGKNQEAFVRSVELVEACAKIEDLAFIETPKKLAGLLKHFDLIPKSNGSERGYDLTCEWVETWQSRYPKPKP